MAIGVRGIRAAACMIGLAGVVAAAGCSSGGGGSTSSAATPKAADKATGSPIVVASIIGPQQPADDQAGINSAVNDINAHGGVGGHPLRVIYCNDNGDANTAAACARSAIANKSVVAAVSDDTNYGSAVDPILTQAGIAMIGGVAFTTADFTSKNFFSYQAGNFEVAGEAAIAADQLHAKKIFMPYLDIPAGSSLPPLINATLAPRGQKLAGSLAIPVTATDLSSYVAKVQQAHPDAIITALTTDLAGRFVQTARQEGIQTPIFVLGGVYDPSTIQSQLGGAATNLYVASRLNLSSPAFQQMSDDLTTYQPSYKKRNTQILSEWGGVQLFAYVAAHAGKISRTSVLNTANHVTGWQYKGLTPPVNFTTPQTALGGTIPRMVNLTVYGYKWNSSKLAPIGGLVNLFSK